MIYEADQGWNYNYNNINVEFTNPILCHRYLYPSAGHIDSDLHDERKQMKVFSKNFTDRINHIDFGT